MSSKKSTNPMQYRIEVVSGITRAKNYKVYYRNPSAAYESYENFCNVYKDSEVMLFDNLHNELIYRRDGAEVKQKSDNSDNRMRYKVLVEFNNGRVDKYRYFRHKDSAREYYAECVERSQEDWEGTLSQVSFIDVLEDEVLAFFALEVYDPDVKPMSDTCSDCLLVPEMALSVDATPTIVHYDVADSSEELSSDKGKKESFLCRLSKKIKKHYFRLLKSNPR